MNKLICGICCALLLSGNALAAGEGEVRVEQLAKTTTSWDGSQLPPYPQGRPEVTILRIEIPPGVELPLHRHPVINAGMLLRGELTVITDQGKTLHLKGGDPIVEVVDRWHYGKNEGREPAEILIVYAGAAGEPITVKQQ